MKYIVLQCKGEVNLEVPIIFPNMLVHSMTAAQMEALLKCMFPETEVTTISAGDIDFGNVECDGRSSSLNIESRFTQDSDLIDGCDYGSMHI